MHLRLICLIAASVLFRHVLPFLQMLWLESLSLGTGMLYCVRSNSFLSMVYISSMLYSWDTQFWSGTLVMLAFSKHVGTVVTTSVSSLLSVLQGSKGWRVHTMCVQVQRVPTLAAFVLSHQTPKTTMSNSHPIYIIQHSFVQMVNTISLVSSSLNQPAQHRDSTHKQWLTERSSLHRAWFVIFSSNMSFPANFTK